AIFTGLRACVPLKITSSIRFRRKLLDDCSPNTHLIASDRLLLPLPFGPTPAGIASLHSMTVLSANDLKPVISTLLRYIMKPLQLNVGKQFSLLEFQLVFYCSLYLG